MNGLDRARPGRPEAVAPRGLTPEGGPGPSSTITPLETNVGDSAPYDASGNVLGTESGQEVNHHSVHDGVLQSDFDQPWLHGSGQGPVSCSS